MEDLEQARRRWTEERPMYQAFCQVLLERIRDAAMSTGISCEVSGRVKEVDSFVKKLRLKPSKTYDDMGDKVGIRIITKYLSDVEPLLSAIQSAVECSAHEDTAKRLGHEKVGYRGHHVDVKLPQALAGPYGQLAAELQVRTLGQHVWSEMAHDTVYKGAERFPEALKRRIYLQAALLEIADEEFSRVSREIANAPGMEMSATLSQLSQRYYRLTEIKFDYELSLDVLPDVISLYESPEQLLRLVDDYVEAHAGDIQEVFRQQSRLPEKRSIYLFQPEVLAIVERLKHARRKTLRLFGDRQDFRELERTATAFGISLE